MATSLSPRVDPNFMLARNGAHAGRMRPLLNELERLAALYTALADHADVRNGKLTMQGFLAWAAERVQDDFSGGRVMNPLTASQLRRRLSAPDVTTTTPDGAYRLDVDRAVAAYVEDPARFHAATGDNPEGDPVLALILTDGPWWVPQGPDPARRFRVTQHGSTIAEVASHYEALHVIHKRQPQSADYAMAYDGYAIQEVSDNEVSDNDARECAQCGDSVGYLSSRDWCDSCEMGS